MRVLLDTNVVLRSLQTNHPHSATARNALDNLNAAGHELCVVPQVIYELWVVATRPPGEHGLGLPLVEADQEVTRLLAATTLLPDPPDLLDAWRSCVLRNQVSGKRAHDARLVAAMDRHGISRILTFNDKDFAGFPGLTVLAPSMA